MTVSSTVAQIEYAGDGLVVAFPTTFEFLADGDLTVVLRDSAGVETTLTETTHYTVTGANVETGGTVTMITAPASGEVLALRRDTAKTQGIDYVANDPFPAETHEAGLDRLTMISQEVGNAIARAITAPVSDTNPDLELPIASERASQFLTFDGSGNVSLSSGTGAADTALRADLGSIISAVKGSALVGVFQSLSGYIGRTLFAWIADRPVSVKDFGAVGDGVTNDSAAVALAIAATPDGGRIEFAAGDTYLLSTKLDLPDKDLHFIGYGATLTTASGNAVFEQTNHRNYNTWRGFKFTGDGVGIQYTMATNSSVIKEYLIEDCDFQQDIGVFAISLTGAKTGYVQSCNFKTCNGIYHTLTSILFVDSCVFDGDSQTATYGIHSDGANSAFSTGPYISNTMIFQYINGLYVDRCEDMLVTGSTIDFNINSIQIYGQDGGKIVHSYIGSDANNNAAIILGLSTAVVTENFLIAENEILGHQTVGSLYDCIQIASTTFTRITNNKIHFWTRYGINYDGDTNMKITGNDFNPRATYGVAPLYDNANDDSSNFAMGNIFVTFDPSTTNMLFGFNPGYSLTRTGVATINSGNTSITVTHGSDETPNHVIISRTNDTTNSVAEWWVANITATQFDIVVNTDPGAAHMSFAWETKLWNRSI